MKTISRSMNAIVLITAILSIGSTSCNSQFSVTSDGTYKDGPAVGYPGAGTAGAGDPLRPGIGPENACECSARTTEPVKSDVLVQTLDCFWEIKKQTIPAAAIEQLVEVLENGTRIHIRLTLDPRFVDNTYGINSIGWGSSKKGMHEFKELVGSDHAEMKLFDTQGKLVLQFKVDYISESDKLEHPSGYGTLGVTGGDGKMIVGNASAILGAATSLDRNLNGCELGMYLEDSPATDAQYTPNPDAPHWDYRVVYEVWVDAAPFGQSGFGDAIVEHVHASPSKIDTNTIEVLEGECPSSGDSGDGGDGGSGDGSDDAGEGGGGNDDCNPKFENCDESGGGSGSWSEAPI
jgi:hypothetical protein